MAEMNSENATIDERARRALADLLRLDEELAAQIRGRTPSRPRPRRQEGPTADFS